MGNATRVGICAALVGAAVALPTTASGQYYPAPNSPEGVIGAIINIINPDFMSLLWKDPVGLNLVYGCLIMFVIGVFWMWRIIQIRV